MLNYSESRETKKTLYLSVLIITLIILGAFGYYMHFNKSNSQSSNNIPSVLSETDTAPNIEPIPLNYDVQDLTVVTNLMTLITENHYEPTPEEIKNKERKEALRNYFASYKSPLAKDDKALDALLAAKNMKMVIAISYVESTFCKFQLYFNCSGIGGSSQFRKYPDFAAWVVDMDSLLERRYKGYEVEEYIGVYVQPGSQNWVNGVYQVLSELKHKKID